MPIVAFNSVSDGLEPHRRSRGHFITNTKLEDERLWVPLRQWSVVPALLVQRHVWGIQRRLEGFPWVDGWNALPRRHSSRVHDAWQLAIP